MLVCIIECCMVDAFRAYEYEAGTIEIDANINSADNSTSRVTKFTTMVVDSMLKRAEIDCAAPTTHRTTENMCYLELIGHRTVSKSGAKGEGKRTYPYKLACVQCKKAIRMEVRQAP